MKLSAHVGAMHLKSNVTANFTIKTKWQSANTETKKGKYGQFVQIVEQTPCYMILHFTVMMT